MNNNNNNTQIINLQNRFKQLQQMYNLLENQNNNNREKFLNQMNIIQTEINELTNSNSLSGGKRKSRKSKRKIGLKNKTKKYNRKMKGKGLFKKDTKKDTEKEDFMKGIKPRKIKGRSINYTNMNPANSIGWQERW